MRGRLTGPLVPVELYGMGLRWTYTGLREAGLALMGCSCAVGDRGHYYIPAGRSSDEAFVFFSSSSYHAALSARYYGRRHASRLAEVCRAHQPCAMLCATKKDPMHHATVLLAKCAARLT
jgi:hypothetical protein